MTVPFSPFPEGWLQRWKRERRQNRRKRETLPEGTQPKERLNRV
jgi:hypothetical protein